MECYSPLLQAFGALQAQLVHQLHLVRSASILLRTLLTIVPEISESSVASETAQPTAEPATTPDSSASQLTGGALSLLAVAGLAMIL